MSKLKRQMKREMGKTMSNAKVQIPNERENG